MADVFGAGTAVGVGRTFAGVTFSYGWVTKASVIGGTRYGSAAEELNGLIYITGGYMGQVVVVHQAYDPVSNTWADKAYMPAARLYGMMVAAGGKLYFLGGQTSTSGGSRAEVVEYDPVANTWTSRASMPRSRSMACAAVVDGKIYVMGGRSSSAVDMYDPTTNTWTTKAATFPTPRDWLDCADGGDGYIYVGGGYDGSTQSALWHRYDPVADTFTARTSIPQARYGHAVTRKGSLIYVTGGYSSSVGYLATHYAYDIATNSWSQKASMSVARYLTTSAPGPGGIYVLTGNNGAALSTNEHHRAPEVLGVGSAVGQGVVVSNPRGTGTLVGVGVLTGAGDVEFSGRTMQPGPIRLDERP